MIKQTIVNIVIGIVVVFANSASILAEQLDTTVSIPPLVISEVQNNGELDNTSTQEFIELYNPGTQPINILDWQVVYRNSSGNESVLYKFAAPRLVLPGEFIIGKHSATVTSYIPEITADFTYGSTGLAQTAGGVVLKDDKQMIVDEVRWTKATTYVNDMTISGLLGGVSVQRVCDSSGIITYTGSQIHDYVLGSVTPKTITCDEPVIPIPPVDDVDPVETTPPDTEAPIVEPDVVPDANASDTNNAQLPVYINELFIDPVSPLTDASDEYVELYNPHAEAINLSGYTIIAGTTTKYRYTFTDGTMINAGAYVTVTSGETPLTLSNSGGLVEVVDTTGARVSAVEYLNAQPGESWAINNGGVWEWTSSPTFNTVNIITAPVVAQKTVVATKATTVAKKAKTTTTSASKKSNFSVALPIQLNEIYPDPKSPQTDANDEFIELYNPYPYAINITDYTIIAGTTKTSKYVLPKGSIIAANGYFVITSADTSLSLTNTTGQVRLLNNFDKQIDTVAYEKAKTGSSWARDDIGKWQWTDVVTKGIKNSIELASSSASTKAKTKATAVAGATVAGTDDTPLTPAPQPLPTWVLALIGVSAVCYAAYEYRFEARNYIYKFRANRTAG